MWSDFRTKKEIMKQGKVWGFTSHLFGKNNVSIHRIEIEPGGYCSKHKHSHKWNRFYIEEGELDVQIWKNDYDLVDTTRLYKNEFLDIKPGEFHRFLNTSTSVAIVYEIYWVDLNEGDIEREDVGGSDKQIIN